jgi:hypothetical protein
LTKKIVRRAGWTRWPKRVVAPKVGATCRAGRPDRATLQRGTPVRTRRACAQAGRLSISHRLDAAVSWLATTARRPSAPCAPARLAPGPARDLSPREAAADPRADRVGRLGTRRASLSSFTGRGAQQGNSYFGATGIPPASPRAAVTFWRTRRATGFPSPGNGPFIAPSPGVAKPRAFARARRAVSRADMTRGAGGPGRDAFQGILRGARHAPAWKVLVPSGRFSPRLETGDGCVTVNLGRLDGP